MLAAFARNCMMINGHEANTTTLLYNCLREAGFGARQISLGRLRKIMQTRTGMMYVTDVRPTVLPSKIINGPVRPGLLMVSAIPASTSSG